MNKYITFGIGCLWAALTVVCLPTLVLAQARKSQSSSPLTTNGDKLLAKYSNILSGLQAEIAQDLPKVDEQQKAAFQKAREEVKAAEATANRSQPPLNNIQKAKALVEHAKGKWIGGTEKGIAKAQGALNKATTEAQREAAQKELAKWQANKEDGLKALKERQAALDKAKLDEPKLIQANQAAQAALAKARTNELLAAKALLAKAESFLSNYQLDAKLVKCAVLANATPRGLAEFAQQSPEQETLVEKLLSDTKLMKEMLEAGGAKAGKYGQAMKIYADIQSTSSRAKQGILQRLALGTSLEQAVPIGQRNAVTETNAPTSVDPVNRYLHYEKAYLDGELDPAFKNMTAWECRFITNAATPDHVLAWGREMLRNYRPDHIFNADYGWRYSGAVRTDVQYRSSTTYTDTDSLEFFQNVIKNGGICGRRAFFGRFIVQSFGIPAWGVTQHAHAAVGHWTPKGWVVNLGANWQHSWFDGRTGTDFLLETQARKSPKEYWKVLRAQWVGDALSEQKFNSMKAGTGGLWNLLALYEKKAIVAEAKPIELPALGQELGEANESPATKALAVEKATITAADKMVVIAPNGVVTIPAAVCGGAQLVKSFLGGQQLFSSGGSFHFDIDIPRAGKYVLTARVVTVHENPKLLLTANNAKEPVEIAVPYTIGKWGQTPPMQVSLAQGKNSLRFSRPAGSRGLTIKDFTLTPVK